MRALVGIVSFALLLALSAVGYAQTALSTQTADAEAQKYSFVSQALGRSMPYEVLLPSGYAASQERYPVLYLLHGWQGDEMNYVTLTHIAADLRPYKLIVVMPRAENSWYVNSSAVPSNRFADYIFKDLIADVDKRFRTLAVPESRAIAGLSMGGYGALLLSVQHPGAFGFVGALSGAFDGPNGIEAVMPLLKQSTDAAFGEQGSETRKSDDLHSLLATLPASSLPPVFLACGSADPLLASNRSIVKLLSANHFVYEYHELPGAHTWTFWSQELAPMLDSLSKALHVVRQPSSSPTTGDMP